MRERINIDPAELKAWRRRRRYTQLDLAGVTGLSCSFIEQIEQGRRQPSIEVAERIAAALDADLSDLGSVRV